MRAGVGNVAHLLYRRQRQASGVRGIPRVEHHVVAVTADIGNVEADIIVRATHQCAFGQIAEVVHEQAIDGDDLEAVAVDGPETVVQRQEEAGRQLPDGRGRAVSARLTVQHHQIRRQGGVVSLAASNLYACVGPPQARRLSSAQAKRHGGTGFENQIAPGY